MLIGRFPLSSHVHSAPGSHAQSCCKCLIGQVSQGKGKKSGRFCGFNIGNINIYLAPVKFIIY